MLDEQTINRIDRHIDAHIDKPIMLADLAEIAMLSEAHFAREFKTTLSVSPGQYLIHRRIARAAHLLGSTDLSILQVSLAVGYSSQSHFCSTFRESEFEHSAKIAPKLVKNWWLTLRLRQPLPSYS